MQNDRLQKSIIVVATAIAMLTASSASAYGGHYRHSYGYGHGHHMHGYGGYGYRGYGSYRSEIDTKFGSVRIKMKPRQAEVFVNGALAGKVDDFDGRLQRLYLEPGTYTIEVRMAGYEGAATRIHVSPGQRFKLEGPLEPLAE